MTKAIIVGGGHNGLTAASLLARRGVATTVLEARDEVGGMGAAHEFAPGFFSPGCALFLRQLQADVVSSLNLDDHGLARSTDAVSSVSLSMHSKPVVRDERGVFGRSLDVADKASFSHFHERMSLLASTLTKLNNRRPPRLDSHTLAEKAELARLALDVRSLGREALRELLRVGASNIYDVLNEWFIDPQLKGLFALDAVLGSHLGPRSGNTMLTFLHQLSGSYGSLAHAPIGSHSLSSVQQRAALACGVNIRTGTRVQQVLVRDGAAVGVLLDTGESLEADVVVSNLDPRTTVLDLVGARHFDTGFVRRISHIRMSGNVARLDLALSARPIIPGSDETHYAQRLVIAPSPDHVERAFNPVKYGLWPEEAVMEFSLPSVSQPDCAPDGKHVLSATVPYVPFALKDGWDNERKQQLAHQLIAQLERYMPGISTTVEACSLLTPVDIAQKFGICGGHWHHGELTLDQFLFVRPTQGAAQYALPVNGLYLCGAGAHPGGGLSGSPGRNCALEILKREAR